MLKKLFKYEFRDFIKIIKFAWFAFLGACVLTSVSYLLTSIILSKPADATTDILLSFFSTGSTGLMMIGISTVMILTIVFFFVSFFKSMLSNEGYLTHSLPFRADQLLNVKVLCGVLVLIIDIAVIAFGIFIAVLPTLLSQTTLTEAVNNIFFLIGELYKSLGVGYGIALTAEFCLYLICTVFISILFPVFCMSLGQRFKNRILASIIIYIGTAWGLELVATFSFFILMMISLAGGLPALEDLVFLPTITVLGAIAIVIEAGLALVFYFVSRNMLTKKLNLV